MRFDAVARATGTARIQMTARLGSESDAFEDAIPVEVLVSPETVAAYGDTATQAKERWCSPRASCPVSAASTWSCPRPRWSVSVKARAISSSIRTAARNNARLERSRCCWRPTLARRSRCRTSIRRTSRPSRRRRSHELERYPVSGGGFAYWPGECLVGVAVPHELRAARVPGGAVAEVQGERVGHGQGLRLPRRASSRKPAPENESWWPGLHGLAGVRGEGARRRRPQPGFEPQSPLRLPRSHAGLRARVSCTTRSSRRASRDARLAELHRRIENAVLPEGGSAHVEELNDPYLLWFWNSNVRSTAIVLNHSSTQAHSPTRPARRWSAG